VLVSPKVRGKAREALMEAARAGQDLDEDQARYVRVVEYEVPDRDGDGKGEVIALVTTVTGMTAAATLLTNYALSALICRAATEAASTPTGSSSSEPSASSAAGPPTRRPSP
jgi:hypothetical protein